MSRDITSQEEHALWASLETSKINYAPENDEQSLTHNAFAYGLIAARKLCGNYDYLDTKQQLSILKKLQKVESGIGVPSYSKETEGKNNYDDIQTF